MKHAGYTPKLHQTIYGSGFGAPITYNSITTP